MADRNINYNWFINNEFSQYSGEWIAIINKNVVAHEKNIKSLIQDIKQKYPGKKPSIVKISNAHRIL